MTILPPDLSDYFFSQGTLSPGDYVQSEYLEHPFLQPVNEITRRKQWEIITELLTITKFLAARDTAFPRILLAGAGTERTGYWLTTQEMEVRYADRYFDPGIWLGAAPSDFPKNYCLPPYLPTVEAWASEVEIDNVIVVPCDLRDLPFPENYFDAAISTSTIELVGNGKDAEIIKAGKEIYRVLKPGGLFSMTTEMLIAGEGRGWDGVRVYSNFEDLQKCFILPSRFTFDAKPFKFSGLSEMVKNAWSLLKAVEGEMPEVETALSFQGHIFTSAHVALFKGDPRG